MSDWTQGPARWIAAVVLGGASIAGMLWSVSARRPADVTALPSEPVGAALEGARPMERPVLGGLIDLNEAAAAELELLPGIGPTLAQRIIEDRAANGAYERVEDLQRVRGIGPRTVEKIAPMATVGE